MNARSLCAGACCSAAAAKLAHLFRLERNRSTIDWMIEQAPINLCP
jgi:hypothetical protein